MSALAEQATASLMAFLLPRLANPRRRKQAMTAQSAIPDRHLRSWPLHLTQWENQELATSKHQEKAIQRWMDERAARQESGAGQAPAKQTQKKSDKSGKVRPRRWAEVYLSDPEGYDDLDIETRERVMPEGETEWRQAKVIRSPLHEGIGGAGQGAAGCGRGPTGKPDRLLRGPTARSSRLRPGCTRSRRRRAGTSAPCARRSASSTAGTATCWRSATTWSCRTTATSRASWTRSCRGAARSARPDPFNVYKQQVIVANVDQLLIVAAWRNPGFWPELVDRYLIAALRHNLAPILAINKVDLAEDRWDLDGVAQAYRLTGCRSSSRARCKSLAWTNCAA